MGENTMTGHPTSQPGPPLARRLAAIAALFLKLGFTAFGGPAAHVAMMRDEVVTRRGWLDDQHFLDMLGATNLIPGPNSSEMSIHIGYTVAGLPGMIVAGLCWMLPAFGMVLVLSWVYVRFGATPTADALMYGIKPVIIPIIVMALWSLGRRAVKGWLTGIVGAAVLALYLLWGNVLALLVAGGLVVMAVENARRLVRDKKGVGLLLPGMGAHLVPLLAGAAAPFSLGVMFLTFLKVGAVLYGGGYTLFAFLEADFVRRLGWLTEPQLIDAIAVGQMTPGPLFTTTTFIGYVLGTQFGLPPVPTAALATLGFYIPSFVFVAISNPIIPHVRESAWASGFLDGVNVAALGAMAGVTLHLGQAAFTDPAAVVIGVLAAAALFRFRVNSVWLVIGGAAAGLLASLVR
jgi:chromate transporter